MQHVSSNLARYHLYKCRDSKWIALACLEEKFWMKFVEKIKIPPVLFSKGRALTGCMA